MLRWFEQKELNQKWIDFRRAINSTEFDKADAIIADIRFKNPDWPSNIMKNKLIKEGTESEHLFLWKKGWVIDQVKFLDCLFADKQKSLIFKIFDELDKNSLEECLAQKLENHGTHYSSEFLLSKGVKPSRYPEDISDCVLVRELLSYGIKPPTHVVKRWIKEGNEFMLQEIKYESDDVVEDVKLALDSTKIHMIDYFSRDILSLSDIDKTQLRIYCAELRNQNIHRYCIVSNYLLNKIPRTEMPPNYHIRKSDTLSSSNMMKLDKKIDPNYSLCGISLCNIEENDLYIACISMKHFFKHEGSDAWFLNKMMCPTCRQPMVACVYKNC